MTPPNTRTIARAATLVMVFFALSRALGLARDVVIAGQFGTNPDYEAYLAAFRLPDFLFNVVSGGALGSAFIPTFTGYLTRDDREGAWRLASAIINWVLVVLIGLGTLAGQRPQPNQHHQHPVDDGGSQSPRPFPVVAGQVAGEGGDERRPQRPSRYHVEQEIRQAKGRQIRLVIRIGAELSGNHHIARQSQGAAEGKKDHHQRRGAGDGAGVGGSHRRHSGRVGRGASIIFPLSLSTADGLPKPVCQSIADR